MRTMRATKFSFGILLVLVLFFLVEYVSKSTILSNMMVGNVITTKTTFSACGEGMRRVTTSDLDFCIDQYEASAGDVCLFHEPTNTEETKANIATSACIPVSKKGRFPWRYVSQQEAEDACRSAGKRLPTSFEWNIAVAGTPVGGHTICNTSNENVVTLAGEHIACVSTYRVYDMIGNVWEWTSDTAEYGIFNGSELPDSGYIIKVDEYGNPRETDVSKESRSSLGRLWIDSASVTGVMRGGSYANKLDAGRYSLYAASPPTFAGDAVGFRCVKDVL